eukprot:2352923-Pyramimonas_sp.AAC.1
MHMLPAPLVLAVSTAQKGGQKLPLSLPWEKLAWMLNAVGGSLIRVPRSTPFSEGSPAGRSLTTFEVGTSLSSPLAKRLVA